MKLTDVIGPIAIGLVVYIGNMLWKRFGAPMAAQLSVPPVARPNVVAPVDSAALATAATGSPTMPRPRPLPRKRLGERMGEPGDGPSRSSGVGTARRQAQGDPGPQTLRVAEVGDAFPGLDLTLPSADQPVAFRTVRRPAPVFRGTAPGSRAWGVQAIVAMEVLGPPVSLRSGATLGAPHAF